MLKTTRGKLLIPILSVVVAVGMGMGYASYRVGSDAVTAAAINDGARSVRSLT
ncbi:MAG: hypothetical protein LBD42_02065 [Desulfovibrio sp.]|jgi:hypothetical protein|nr:hypothetical protein [Desulfovibrio sp.]